jgi:hypothetical protein
VGDSALKAAAMVSNAEGSAPAAAFVTAEGNAVPGRRDWHRQAGANAASATAGSSMHRQVLESTSGAFSVMVWPSQWLLDTALAAMAGWLCSFSVVQQLLQLL